MVVMSSLQYFPRNPASVGRSPYAAATLYLFALAVEGPEPVLLILWRPLREETTGTPCTPRYPGGGGHTPGSEFRPHPRITPPLLSPCYWENVRKLSSFQKSVVPFLGALFLCIIYISYSVDQDNDNI